MRRLLLALALLFGVILAAAPLAAAQTDEVDVPEIGETVLDADPETIVEGLEEPPADEDLPEGFINPPDGTPQNAEISEAFTSEVSELEETMATVNFTFDTDPVVVPGIISTGILTYIIFEEKVTAEVFDVYRSSVEEGAATPVAGAEISVDEVEVAGVDGVLATFNQSDDAGTAMVQLLSVPVGNVIVVGTVVSADRDEVDPEAIRAHAEDLTLAGVEYLGTLADE